MAEGDIHGCASKDTNGAHSCSGDMGYTVFLPFKIHQHANMEPLRLKKIIVSQCIYLKKKGKKLQS